MDRHQLAERRKALGLSRAQLAAIVGVQRLAVYRWETGERAIPPMLDAAMRDFERRRQPGQTPASADVLWVMEQAGVGQEAAVRMLGGTP